MSEINVHRRSTNNNRLNTYSIVAAGDVWLVTRSGTGETRHYRLPWGGTTTVDVSKPRATPAPPSLLRRASSFVQPRLGLRPPPDPAAERHAFQREQTRSARRKKGLRQWRGHYLVGRRKPKLQPPPKPGPEPKETLLPVGAKRDISSDQRGSRKRQSRRKRRKG